MKERRKLVITIVAVFAAILLFSTFLVGCGSSDGDRESKDIVEEEEKYGNFVVLSRDILSGPGYIEQYIMYDPQTKIMWTYVEGNDGGGLSIIYNVDGTPVLYQH